MKQIANLPPWFDEHQIAKALLFSNRAFSQEELEVMVDFYTNYRFHADSYWEAYVTIDGVRATIKYCRIDGEYLYEQPEVSNV